MASAADLLQDHKLVDDCSEYISHYLEKQVHPDAPEDFKVMVGVILLEGFEAGAAWADSVAGRSEKTLILTPNMQSV